MSNSVALGVEFFSGDTQARNKSGRRSQTLGLGLDWRPWRLKTGIALAYIVRCCLNSLADCWNPCICVDAFDSHLRIQQIFHQVSLGS